MKVLMKFGIALVVLAMVTSGASARNMWWDFDADPDASWGNSLNWNEGQYVEIPGYMDDNGTPEDPGDDFWVDPIPGYGNDILPHLNMNVAIMNIETTATNLGVAGPIQVNIGTGVAAEAADLYLGWSSFSSDAVTVTVDGGSLTTAKHVKMGQVDGDVVVLNLLDGEIDIRGVDRNSHLHIGYGKDDPDDDGKLSAADSGGVATFNMAAGTTLTVDQDLEVTYFAGTTGTFTAVGDGDAGTIDIVIGDDFRVAGNDHNGGDSVGVFTITDIAMEVGDVLEMGRFGNGTITANNSSITLVNGGNDVVIGYGGTAPDGTTTGTGLVTLNSSSLNATDDLLLGHEGTGTLILTGSSSVDIDDRLEIAREGGTGTVTLSGTSTLDVGTGSDNNRRLYLGGNGGTATLTLNDDSVTWVYDDIYIGESGSTAYLNINDNASLTSGRDDLELGNGGATGIMTMTGGTVNIGDDFELAKDNPGEGSTGTLLMSGGVINIDSMMKMGQSGGVAIVNMTGGLINIDEAISITHLDTSKDMTGTVGHLTLGDGDDEEIAFGAATISTAELRMDAAYDSTDGAGNPVAIDAWVDFQPGGLLLIDDDVTAYIAQLIADGLLLTTYTGDYFGIGVTAAVGYDYGVTEMDRTAVYLVPEPATLLLVGLGGLLLRRKKRVS